MRKSLPLLLLSLMTATTPAVAAPATYSFSGHITAISGTFPDSAVSVGSPFVEVVTFDTEAADTVPTNSRNGIYLSSGPPFGIATQVGTFSCSAATVRLAVLDDFSPGVDGLQILSDSLGSSNSALRCLPSPLVLLSRDDIFSSDALPPSFPDASSFAPPLGISNQFVLEIYNQQFVVVAQVRGVVDAIAPLPDDDDTDEDGLWDSWETSGLDYDKDGHVDTLLDDAEVSRKDVYVYYDWLVSASGASYEPSAAVLNVIAATFETAPAVSRSGRPLNPDGSTGIALHFIRGKGIAEDHDNRVLDDDTELTAIQSANMPKRFWQVAHYALFGHYVLGTFVAPTGLSRGIPGSAFAVASGYIADLGTAVDLTIAGTLMHELGHNLGLGHGGVYGLSTTRDLTKKPNHLSVMNYSFQIGGLVRARLVNGAEVYDHSGVLDFSRYSSDQLPTLFEGQLTESVGLAGDPTVLELSKLGSVRYCGFLGVFSPKRFFGPATSAHVDWDCLPTWLTGDSVSASIDAHSGYDALDTTDEWGNLTFTSAQIGSLATPGGAPLVDEQNQAEPEPAISIEDIQASQPAFVVAIDIKPGPGPNAINANSRGSIPVAILSDPSFDAVSQIDSASLAFGRSGYESPASRCAPEDVNGDQRQDLLCHFDSRASDFRPGDIAGTIRGRTLDKRPVLGVESIVVVN